jgi:UDP-GlcNAc:undecaprenyl-phosphate/decaprenyl-phosphate GlcNAc-1-phosphate transferase
VSRARRERGSAVLAALTGLVVSASWPAARRGLATPRWQRRNYRDRVVSLALGPAVGLGVVAGLAAGPHPRRGGLIAVGSAAAVGLYDDLFGDQHARGLAGHARALRAGRITTGMIKLVTIGTAAAVGSRLQHEQVADVAIGTVLVAGGANLVNLFDLRPGRAAKVTVAAAAALATRSGGARRAVAAVAGGAALAALPVDLGERGMLGDAGAGALGALLGWSAALGGSRAERLAVAAGVTALTAVSERVSFSAVIDRRPVLRAFDRLGRQLA